MLLSETYADLVPDGRLRFQIPGRRTHYVLSPWARGFTSLCVRPYQSFPAIPWSVGIAPPPGEERPRNPVVDAFIADIPQEVLQRVRPYQFGQFLLLSSMATLPEACDVAESNPHLLWLLAVGVNLRRITTDQIATLCRMKQAEILRVLTGEGSKAQVRFLRKVRIAKGTMACGDLLYRAVGNPAIVRALRHLPQIPIGLAGLLVCHPSLAREELVPLLAAQSTVLENDTADSIRPLHGALAVLELAAGLPIAKFREQLEDTLHEFQHGPRLRVRDAPAASSSGIPSDPSAFPPPPLRGTRTIQPLTNVAELEEEGRVQRHCVGSYVHSVRAGCHYFYRVLAPQRATLEIELSSGEPEISHVRLAGNATPSRSTMKAVRKWFRAACAEAAKNAGSASTGCG